MVEGTIIVFTIIIFSFFIGESILESCWKKGIFTKGIVIYSKEYSFTKIPSIRELEENNQSRILQPITFKEYNKNEFGFREAMLPASFLAYTPIMRGYIFIRFDDHILQIKGFVNYRTLFLILLFVFFTIFGLYHGSFIVLAILPCLLFVIGILYLIQMNRFAHIGEFISRLK